MAGALAANWRFFIDYVGLVVFAVFLHNALALNLGYWSGRLAGLTERDARATCIELGIQNSALGLVLVWTPLGNDRLRRYAAFVPLFALAYLPFFVAAALLSRISRLFVDPVALADGEVLSTRAPDATMVRTVFDVDDLLDIGQGYVLDPEGGGPWSLTLTELLLVEIAQQAQLRQECFFPEPARKKQLQQQKLFVRLQRGDRLCEPGRHGYFPGVGDGVNAPVRAAFLMFGMRNDQTVGLQLLECLVYLALLGMPEVVGGPVHGLLEFISGFVVIIQKAEECILEHVDHL